MLESGWIFLGRIAFIWTLSMLAGSLYIGRDDDDSPLIIGSVIGIVFWAIWAFGALNVEVADGGVVFEFSSPPLLAVGLGMVIVNAYIAIEGSMSAVARWREAEPEDF